MSFFAPFFLLATAAAAIPVVLHMIHRRQAKELPFSTLRFLRISAEKTRRRRRIHDVLLMLVRAAVLFLIALGLAGPTIVRWGALWGGSGSAVAIVLDNSAGMGTVDKGRPRFQTAVAAARQILDQLHEGDEAALFTTGGRPFPEQGKLDASRQGVIRMLDQCVVSYERADLAMRVHQARRALAASPAANRRIFVVTDMQKNAWTLAKGQRNDAPPGSPAADASRTAEAADSSGAAEAADAGETAPGDGESAPGGDIPVVVIDCNREPQPNASVQGVEIDTAIPVAGVPIKATAEIFNAGPESRQRVELYLDGAKEAASPDLNVAREGRTTYAFRFTLSRGGVHRGEVRLVGEDGSAYDNRRFFAVEADQGIPAAVVTPKRHDVAALDEAYYLQAALAPSKSGGSAIRAAVLEAKDLASEPLNNFAVVYCVNLPTPSPEAAERLAKFVASGGNLFWICGDNVVPEEYNRMNEQARGELLPASLGEIRSPDASKGRDSWSIGFLDKRHPALASLIEPPSLYQSVLVYRHVRLDAAALPNAWILARLDDGEPLLVHRKGVRGSTTVLGTSVHKAWTNLPLRPIFLPLTTRLAFELAGVSQAQHSVAAGASILLPLEEETRPVTVEVIPPSGAQTRLPSKAEPGRPGQMFRYADTHDVGFYSLRVLDAARAASAVFAANVDPDEADPTKIERAELTELLSPANVLFVDDPEDLSSTFKILREGKSLWSTFLIAVLIVLVFEGYLAERFSPKPSGAAEASPRPGLPNRPYAATK